VLALGGQGSGMAGAGREAFEGAFAELRALYAELDREIGGVLRESAGASCRACGECCSFPPQGPVLYATAPERELLASAPPPPGTPACAAGGVAAGRHPDGACPYLRETKCTARERRPVGCRTHFCPSALPPPEAREACEALGGKALAEIRGIVERHGLPWDYAPVVERLAARSGPSRRGSDDAARSGPSRRGPDDAARSGPSRRGPDGSARGIS
jgi:Fe-S-cluster containining protein